MRSVNAPFFLIVFVMRCDKIEMQDGSCINVISKEESCDMKKKIVYLIATVFLAVSLVSPVAAFAEAGNTADGGASVNNESRAGSDNDADKVPAGSESGGQTAVKSDTDVRSGEQKAQSSKAENNDVESYYAKSISYADVTLSQDSFYYDGMPKTPEVSVSYSGNKLTKGKDYYLEYMNNVDAGEARVIVYGKGDYGGSITEYFYIYYDENDIDVILEKNSYTFQGVSIKIKPDATVRLKSTGENITGKCGFSYSDNINAGTAYVIVKSEKYYRHYDYSDKTGVYFKDSVKKAFTIKPLKIKSAYLSDEVYHYNGKKKTPALVNYHDEYMYYYKKNKEYTVKYLTNCKSVGKHKIKYTFRGNYTGSVTKSFKILPSAPKVKSKNKKGKSVTIYWKKVKGATGYKVYKDGKLYKTTKKTSIRLTAKKNRSYLSYYVESYKKNLGTSYNGSYHEVVFGQPRTSISLSRPDWGEIKVKIKNYDNQYYHNYQFQVSNNKKFSNKHN